MPLSRSDRNRSIRKKRRKFLTASLTMISLLVIGTAIAFYSLDRGNQPPQASPAQPDRVSQDRLAGDPDRPTPGTANGAAETQRGKSIKLAFVGDVMWADRVEDALAREGWEYPYLHVKPFLQQADITVANLETPVSGRGAAITKKYAYRSSPAGLPAFKQAGFDLVNLANNHILDYGVEGMLDTFAQLNQSQIRYVGAGRDAQEAYQPVIMQKDGLKVAFLGFSRVVPDHSWKAGEQLPGVAETYNSNPPVESVQRAKNEADVVVVLVHWGKERESKPVEHQTQLAHRYIDAGADLVVGSHPHVLQGFEQYKGKWIAYSLGNFVFTMNPNPVTWESVILDASCSKAGDCRLGVRPIITKLANPQPMDEADGKRLFKRLTNISINTRVSEEGQVTVREGK
jgi:poly-gamma-glutamate capsule biosynthesis protein CapA/YwtB (metallophosphatase superfamily)